MKKLLSWVLTLLFISFFPIQAYAQTAKDVYRALKRIEAKCQTGVNYKDYGEALSDATLELNMYKESKNVNGELLSVFSNVLRQYMAANAVWSFKFKAPFETTLADTVAECNEVFRDDEIKKDLIKRFNHSKESHKLEKLEEMEHVIKKTNKYLRNHCELLANLPTFQIETKRLKNGSNDPFTKIYDDEIKASIDVLIQGFWYSASDKLDTIKPPK